MSIDLSSHPCFDPKARHKYGRIHLPVAPRCNVQCNFCSRDFDCVNESRPGVTSGILLPEQAVEYLDKLMARKKNISVVGIAGPGDPFANPQETLETLKLVREKYPEILLCLATNGLNILPYIEELKNYNISHVTITISAVDPEIIKKIYAWYRYDKRVHNGAEGAPLILSRQLEAVRQLKAAGITVKINTIVLPGINEKHIAEVARVAAENGADVQNCIPCFRNTGTPFENIIPPTPEEMAAIRMEAGKFIKQMSHCARCRADAAGLLGEAMDPEDTADLKISAEGQGCSGSYIDNSRIEKAVYESLKARPYVAAASREGVFINAHLGEAMSFMILGKDGDGGVKLIEIRNSPESGGGILRWKELGALLSDCGAVFVSGVGAKPMYTLMAMGTYALVSEGLVIDAAAAALYGKPLKGVLKIQKSRCGQSCAGTGGGCG
ncbi:MAG: nitrogenase cofactor biosynthesis protein NifB [Candidatus Goldbacteria bacterium]|nr:nitrogenase cofactor biosynthesis protein NifB [Candidatus Goldiibacteriota bacterium]